MCVSWKIYFYDFLYNSVKTNYNWHTKMTITHWRLRRVYKCIVSSLQLNYIVDSTQLSFSYPDINFQNIFLFVRLHQCIKIYVVKTFICRLSIPRDRWKQMFHDNLFISKERKTLKFNQFKIISVVLNSQFLVCHCYCAVAVNCNFCWQVMRRNTNKN